VRHPEESLSCLHRRSIALLCSLASSQAGKERRGKLRAILFCVESLTLVALILIIPAPSSVVAACVRELEAREGAALCGPSVDELTLEQSCLRGSREEACSQRLDEPSRAPSSQRALTSFSSLT
jgi:hypothetical protein